MTVHLDSTGGEHGKGPHGHDPHSGFQYQPALPIPNGKTCVWLFLSTEIMFFAGLIGAYIVLRFGSAAWPSTHDVHLVEYLGAINTAVLICSSITVVLALEAAKEAINRALGGDHGDNLAREADRFGELFATEDAREGLTAFAEKREPTFKGR